MRRMSFGLGGGVKLSPLQQKSQATPVAPAKQMQSWLRRRLEDAVEDVFRAALQRGDLVIQLDREVQRIFAGSIPGLV